jgi:ribosomal protein S18 acetylase RimI-like enzyme
VSAPTITVRAATQADIDAVLALWEVARSVHSTTPDTVEALQRLLAHDPSALLVAESDGVLVGTLIAGWDGWRGTMARLAVSPAQRRHGIALALVREAERLLRERGVRRINALVIRDDDVACAFWAAAGYAHDPAMTRFVRNL